MSDKPIDLELEWIAELEKARAEYMEGALTERDYLLKIAHIMGVFNGQ